MLVVAIIAVQSASSAVDASSTTIAQCVMQSCPRVFAGRATTMVARRPFGRGRMDGPAYGENPPPVIWAAAVSGRRPQRGLDAAACRGVAVIVVIARAPQRRDVAATESDRPLPWRNGGAQAAPAVRSNHTNRRTCRAVQATHPAADVVGPHRLRCGAPEILSYVPCFCGCGARAQGQRVVSWPARRPRCRGMGTARPGPPCASTWRAMRSRCIRQVRRSATSARRSKSGPAPPRAGYTRIRLSRRRVLRRVSGLGASYASTPLVWAVAASPGPSPTDAPRSI